ncbi:MAG: enoyl-CoA hydratase [Nitrososphaerota archaeon]|nr:enoyl-CoA hydratase [Nitrososphaerota archaeon]
MQSDEVDLKIASKVATITLNRPTHLNAFTIQAVHTLSAALRECEQSKDVSVIVLRGAGEKSFSTGADIALFKDFKNSRDAKNFWEVDAPQVHRFIEKMTKPVICAIDGYCLGGGLEIALACDLTVATKDSKFGFPEVNIALLPGWGGTQRITRILGRLKAKQLVMLGEMIDADEASWLGIVNWVVQREDFDIFVQSLVSKLTQKSTLVLAYAKDVINRAYDLTLEEGLEYETNLDTKLMNTEDTKEGIRAFLEKRKPNYKGV